MSAAMKDLIKSLESLLANLRKLLDEQLPKVGPAPAKAESKPKKEKAAKSETTVDPDPAHNSEDPNDPDPAHHAPGWKPPVKTPTTEPVVEQETAPTKPVEPSEVDEGRSPPTEPEPAPAGDTAPLKELTQVTWLGGWSGNVKDTVRNTVAGAGDKLPFFISYNIPDRDKGNHSAGGLASRAEFKQWAKDIAEGVGDKEAFIIVEPDALGLGLPIDLVQEAVTELSANDGIEVFVDASIWVDPPEMARRLNQLDGLDGFSINVSGYEDMNTCLDYGDKVSALTGLQYVIDTSRNGFGNPHKPAWCNVTDTKVGLKPTTHTESEACVRYVWAKVPGESDGQKINGHDQDGQPNRGDVPRAGDVFPEFKEAIYSGDWTAFHKKFG